MAEEEGAVVEEAVVEGEVVEEAVAEEEVEQPPPEEEPMRTRSCWEESPSTLRGIDETLIDFSQISSPI